MSDQHTLDDWAASILKRIVLFFVVVVTRAMLAELAGLLQRIANMSKVNQVRTCAVSRILFLVWLGLAQPSSVILPCATQMTPKNLAICLAPNIFRSNDLNLLERYYSRSRPLSHSASW